MSMNNESKQATSFFKQYKIYFFALLAAVFFCVLVSAAASVYVYLHLFEPVYIGKNKVIHVKKGENANNIAKILYENGIVNHDLIFSLAIKYLQKEKNIRYGEYAMPETANVLEIIEVLTSGQTIRHSITFPEGMTSWQIVEKLNKDKRFKTLIDVVPSEGTLLPETYMFSRGADRNDIITKMQIAQKKFIDEHWDKKQEGLPFVSKREAIILASMIEKETGKPEERSLVAGVFVNRLKKKMRLQSDPTIIYGITFGKGDLGRPIRKSEIKKRSDYNTYVIKGLPKGPIANPGKAAILAALNPAKTDKFYFVASGDGGHHFSKSYKEHRKNVKKLRDLQKNKNDD